MAYRLEIDEGLPQGVHRLMRTLVRRIEKQLANADDLNATIHRSRRALKRLRALLELVRPAMPEKDWRLDTGRVREIAGMLADVRDAKVMLDTVAHLEAQYGAAALGSGRASLQTALAAQLAEQTGSTSTLPEPALVLLAKLRRRSATYARLAIPPEALCDGLARTYRAGRRAMMLARETGDGEAFHDWRKHVQRHWRHMLLMHAAWPEEMATRAGIARDLARILGEDHDLLVLQAAVAGPLAEAAGPVTAAAVTELTALRQTGLRTLAAPLGLRLYAEPARDLARRVRCYWMAATELAGTAAAGQADLSAEDRVQS